MSATFRYAGTICYSAVTLGRVPGIIAGPLSGAENGGQPLRHRASTGKTTVVHPAETAGAAKGNAPIATIPADTTTAPSYSFGEMSIAGLALNSLNIDGCF